MTTSNTPNAAERPRRVLWLSRLDVEEMENDGSRSAQINAYRECGEWEPGYLCFQEIDSHRPAESVSAEPVASDEDRGLYGKFYVERNDGSSKPGGKHEGCDYFVLDLTHDPFAMPALRAYAANCAKKYPQLAADLREKLPDVDAGWWGSYECFGCSLVFDVQTTYDPDDVVNCPKCKGTCDLRGRWLADVGSFGGRSEFIVLPQPSTPGAVSDEDARVANGAIVDHHGWQHVMPVAVLVTALESFAKRSAAASGRDAAHCENCGATDGEGCGACPPRASGERAEAKGGGNG